MKIMVAGLPGSGKTTQAQKLSADLGIAFFSMGDLLRKTATEDSLIGREVRKAVATGELANNKLTADILEQAVATSSSEGFIIDGFPRDIEQLSFFDPKYDFIFYLKISPEEGRKRLLGRKRHDDNPEVIDHRFEVQQKKLEPLLDHLRLNYQFIELDGEKNIEEIHKQIMEEIKK